QGEQFLIIVEIDKVFSVDELAMAQEIGGEQLPLAESG
ncbi:MAG: chemotaxis protein CheW, partial [Deltaproteobacteria bacterium]|nr:chemotaxis protein CheW [Deltaproteobacteria bacterium]